MKRLYYLILIFAGFTVLMASCQYKFNIEPATTPPDPEETIYFSQDILPIWNNNDNCTSCHNAGSVEPDLTPDNAYNEVMGGYVDTDNPESSEIYTIPHPDSDGHDKKYNSAEAAIVLQWIEQGALNN